MGHGDHRCPFHTGLRCGDQRSALDDASHQTRSIHGGHCRIARRPGELRVRNREAVGVPGLRRDAERVAGRHLSVGGQHLDPHDHLRHRHRRARRRCPRSRGDRNRPVARGRHEPGRIHSRHRDVGAQPCHGDPRHDPAVLVANLGAQLYGLAHRRELGGGRAHGDWRSAAAGSGGCGGSVVSSPQPEAQVRPPRNAEARTMVRGRIFVTPVLCVDSLPR